MLFGVSGTSSKCPNAYLILVAHVEKTGFSSSLRASNILIRLSREKQGGAIPSDMYLGFAMIASRNTASGRWTVHQRWKAVWQMQTYSLLLDLQKNRFNLTSTSSWLKQRKWWRHKTLANVYWYFANPFLGEINILKKRSYYNPPWKKRFIWWFGCLDTNEYCCLYGGYSGWVKHRYILTFSLWKGWTPTN